MKRDPRADDLKSQHTTPADGNVFADLGFPPEKAAELLKDARARLAISRKLKEAAAKQITSWIEAECLTQIAAAQVLAVSRPRVSDLMNSKLAKFSLDTLVSMLLRVGKTVELVIDDRAAYRVVRPGTRQAAR